MANYMVHRNVNGSTLIMAIVAIIVIGALGVGMQQMSASAVFNQLMFNQANQARNLAYSGVKYAKGIALNYKSKVEIDEVVTILNTGGKYKTGTYIVGDDIGSFTIMATKIDSSNLTVTVEGDTPSGSFQSKYQLPVAVAVKFSPIVKTNSDQIAMYGAGAIALNSSSKVNGSIFSASGVQIANSAVVTGNVKSYGAVILNSSSEVSGDICMKGNGTFNNGSHVGGDVRVIGDLTLNGGTVDGTIYVSGKITIQGNAKVHNVYANEVYINSIELAGDVYSKTTINRTGTMYHPYFDVSSKLPTGCDAPVLVPKDAEFTASKEVLIQDQSEYLFTAKNNNDQKYNSIDLKSIMLNNKNKTLKFDLSNGDINILVTGDVTFNNSFSIVVSEDGKNWSDPFDPKNITEKMKEYAKRIYLESHGTVSFNGASSWVGTVYASQVNLNEGTNVLGSVYSKSNQQNANKDTVITLVSSNFASIWWK